MNWSNGRGVLSVITDDAVYVLSEQILHSAMCGNVTVIQQNLTEVVVCFTPANNESTDESKKDESSKKDDNTTTIVTPSVTLNSNISVRGLSVSKGYFTVWNGKLAKVYRTDSQSLKIEPVSTFDTSSNVLVIADTSNCGEESLFVCEDHTVKVLNYGGVQKGSISFTEVEGKPELIDINGKFMAVITNKGMIKIYDIDKPTKPKLIGSGAKFYSPVNNMEIGQVSTPVLNSSRSNKPSPNKPLMGGANRGLLLLNNENDNNSYLSTKSIKVNSDGTRVCIIVNAIEGVLKIRHPHNFMYIYDRLKGSFSYYDFTKHNNSYPVSISWDDTDDRVLCCEVVQSKIAGDKLKNGTTTVNLDMSMSMSRAAASMNMNSDEKESGYEIFIFFATTEQGILLQDSFIKSTTFGPLINISVPKLYFKNLDSTNKTNKLSNIMMRDFLHMGKIDNATKIALLDFSYNLTLGKLDEAYRSVKSINNPLLWENMAQMCIKTKRIDVAEICLSQMGHARGAAALRDSKKENSLEVSAAVLAIQLGFFDDALKLFREAKRYDLVNKLLQSSGKYEKAVKTSLQNDHLHINTTHYNYARHLESIGDIEGAIDQYELSQTANTEIPRMLFQLNKIAELEDYIHRNDDATLWKWWASYMESQNRLEKAYKYFRKAGDYLNCVRIACYKDDFAMAADLIRECGDKAAAYHFARQLETKGEFEAAINFYAEAECLNHSIRLSKLHGMDTELMSYALKSPVSLILDCAQYFESKNDIQKAIQLYHKGGDLSRALDLCFSLENGSTTISATSPIFDLINSIATDLGEKTSPQVLARCAEFLVNNKQYEKSIELYVMAKRYHQAVEMCLQNKIKISDSLLEKLTPPDTVDAATRKEIFKILAKKLKNQVSRNNSRFFTYLPTYLFKLTFNLHNIINIHIIYIPKTL